MNPASYFGACLTNKIHVYKICNLNLQVFTDLEKLEEDFDGRLSNIKI
jgi:hypothetical protein